MNTKQRAASIAVMVLLAAGKQTYAQADTLTLEKATTAALQNNHLVQIRKMQVEERKAKVKEDEVKKYPVAMLNSTYLYNVNTSDPLPLNSISTLPVPIADKYLQLGEHNTFNAAAVLYQPITQQGKIRTGINIAKTDVLITEKEKKKTEQQIRQAVEKIYYGLLINQKQKEEAVSKLEVAKMKLYDVEGALLAGKTVNVDKTGLQASIADEEQTILKLDIQAADYRDDLSQLTGLANDSLFLAGVSTQIVPSLSLEESKSAAFLGNVDLNIATLNLNKAELGIKAARQSYLPDFGLVGGYFYQRGNSVFPNNNPFAGVSFKWNLQDVFANKHVIRQRTLISQQAAENLQNTREQLNNDIEKTHNKIRQAGNLIVVAQKAVNYRREEVKIQMDKRAAGLSTKTDLLNAQSLLAKSEAELYSAQLAYRLSVSDLNILAGN